MPLKFDWTGRDELDRVARIRWQCYYARGDAFELLKRRSEAGRFRDGDVCIASDAGLDVGTATSLSMALHLRGKRMPCQGVAWVGTAKSHRRRSANERGIASQVMEQLLLKARERGQVVSALMPFRASYYEHFGFGVVERQNIWTVPLSVLPGVPEARWRFGTPADKPAMLACRARQCMTGHCDVETDDRALEEWFQFLDPEAQLFVDDRDGQIAAYTWVRSLTEDGRGVAQAVQPAWESPAGFRSALSLLGSLRDQYSFARITLPVHWPINWLFKERQIPHRAVEHAAGECRMISRMQLRVLDHVAFLNGQKLTRPVNAKVTIAVRESEGSRSTFTIDLSSGVIEASDSNASPDVELADVTWAAIAAGELRASSAGIMGLIDVKTASAPLALDVLADGPAPFSYEYF